VELALSFVGILISLAIAAWEYRRAVKAEALLDRTFRELPSQLVADLSRLVSPSVASSQAGSNTSLEVQHADLNGDGKPELLVTYLSGAHNTALQVYGSRSHWDFGLLAELESSTPTEFEVADVDNDGVPEITTVEVAREPGLPYVMGLRDRVSYKLTNSGFVEVQRRKCYSAEDLREALASWHNEDPQRSA
jgi:hypothetical protein